jgi:hypothetical protein
MKTFEMVQNAGADKVLRLAIPVDEPNRQYHLFVMVEEATTNNSPPCHNWPPGFFENTAGKWIGDLERPAQGEFEKREQL